MRLQLLFTHMHLEVYVVRSHHLSYIENSSTQSVSFCLHLFSVLRRRCWRAPSSTATWENVLYPNQIKSGWFQAEVHLSLTWRSAVCSWFSDLRCAARIRSPITVMSETHRSTRMDNEFSRLGGLFLGKHPAISSTWPVGLLSYATLENLLTCLHCTSYDQLSSFKFSNFAYPAKVQSMAWLQTALLRIAAIVLLVGHASPLLTGLILLALGLWAVRLHPRKTLDMSRLAVVFQQHIWDFAMLPGLGEGFVSSTQEKPIEKRISK